MHACSISPRASVSFFKDTHRHLAQQVARELLRLWQLCYAHLGRDHALKYNKQLVDVYLTETGEAGCARADAFNSIANTPITSTSPVKPSTSPIQRRRICLSRQQASPEAMLFCESRGKRTSYARGLSRTAQQIDSAAQPIRR